MPILNVELVGTIPEQAGSGLAQRIADSAGEVFGSRPQGTWVKLRFIEPNSYSENSGGPRGKAGPVFVSVLQSKVWQGAQLSALASELAKAIAASCSRPIENVHVLFEPAAKGRMAFGGKLTG